MEKLVEIMVIVASSCPKTHYEIRLGSIRNTSYVLSIYIERVYCSTVRPTAIPYTERLRFRRRSFRQPRPYTKTGLTKTKTFIVFSRRFNLQCFGAHCAVLKLSLRVLPPVLVLFWQSHVV